MVITIDDKKIEVSDTNKNIVEIADESGIHIPALCFRQEKRSGCCKGCAVMINGELNYACGVKPQNDMNIIVSTNDLEDLRKRNIRKYLNAIEQGDTSSCGCNCSCSNDSSCC
jgi:NADH dehydrogenase/NADH:ubiquinone oxidoreductase subunit G